MRKIGYLLSVLLLLSLAAGCGTSGGSSLAQGGAVYGCSSSGGSSDTVLRLETLNLELPRSGDNTAELAAALQEFPSALKSALAQSGVEADSLHVTVGTSTSATCSALSAGGVDVAFLPTEDFTRYGEGLAGILGDGEGIPGGQVQICTASTERGKALANVAKDGEGIPWDKLNEANWGVVKESEGSVSLTAAASLWLWNEYAGNTISDLSHVTFYDSYDNLARAVDAGDVDVFPLPVDQLTKLAGGLADSTALCTSGALLYDWVAAVKSDNADLLDQRFSTALAGAVEKLCKEDPDRAKAFGAAHFQTVNDDQLDATRRLWTLNG